MRSIAQTAALAAALFHLTAAALTCKTHSQPNPIAKQYPKDVTGTINGTTAIVPIPYDVARSIIPSEYGILRDAYEKLMPDLPKDMYPVHYSGLLDHGLGLGDFKIPDFQRMVLKFPFVDRLNDGYSCFQYSAPLILSFDNLIALAGSKAYGPTFAGSFDPPCDGYADDGQGATVLSAYVVPPGQHLGSKPAFEGRFKAACSSVPYDQKVFVNITNQPIFGSGKPVCDNYITLYNTSVTQGEFAPVAVEGTVKVGPPFYPQDATLEAFGYRMDNAFVERNDVPCEKLKGYAGTGPGDSAGAETQ
ncbi:uncharacterized protein MYCGRDRAFT_108774 [Zymoseptoria tritici IPO323]|uniref:Secreted protein n=1 Tax=Zymoseptoria tritici (strain CBS 115943 / IPO323) TaxID=336722 RepID=F9X565_ZYMTI|nr:uncharacterized protein MYCGRDRAFT_108774 [Zymoseptoria tritici IPO323]EGP89261.1 hypothetical protein MYCGRDRAFT_108774 [Zymoseptoria tritici IPO323]